MAPFERAKLPAHYRDPNYTTGRPTDYRPEYCDLIIETARNEGLSVTAFAGVIGVSKETVYAWVRERPEFSDAVSRAKSARVTWWERKLGRSRKGAETTAAIFALRNADPQEWRDVRHTTKAVTHKIETLSDAELYEIARGNDPGDGTVIDGEYSRVETR
jgi:hypothetical protein